MPLHARIPVPKREAEASLSYWKVSRTCPRLLEKPSTAALSLHSVLEIPTAALA